MRVRKILRTVTGCLFSTCTWRDNGTNLLQLNKSRLKSPRPLRPPRAGTVQTPTTHTSPTSTRMWARRPSFLRSESLRISCLLQRVKACSPVTRTVRPRLGCTQRDTGTMQWQSKKSRLMIQPSILRTATASSTSKKSRKAGRRGHIHARKVASTGAAFAPTPAAQSLT